MRCVMNISFELKTDIFSFRLTRHEALATMVGAVEGKMAFDWSGCDVIESVPGRMGGEPVLKGTRVLADTIVGNFESGSPLQEIHENYPHVSEDAIRKVIAYYERQHQLVI
jgi:uncharacterized protein (DUF433 family)